jgi:hypothetical protein
MNEHRLNFRKYWSIIGIGFLLLSFAACGLFKHRETEPQVQQHDHDHTHDGSVHIRSESGDTSEQWSAQQFPSSNNLYRMMGQIVGAVDTSDHFIPSHADMFIANFSEAYLPQQASGAILQLLSQKLAGCKVYISAAAQQAESKIFVPRMTRLLDQIRFDSSALHYRGWSVSGRWISSGFPQLIADDSEVPYACVVRKGILLGTIRWEDRNQLAAKFLELLNKEGN